MRTKYPDLSDMNLDLPLMGSLMASPAGFGLFDPQERLRDANAAFLAALGTRLEGAPSWESIMRDCHRHRRGLLIETGDIDAWIERVRQRHRQVPCRTFESDLVDGRWMWVNETLQADGWVLVLMVDITPLKANETTLRRARDLALLASLTDSLTELPNRRHIFNRLDDLIVGTGQMRVPLSVAVLDIDHFKQVNDQHGHAVGDRVLQHFARQLRAALRPCDEVGRIGGEEFLLLMPNTPIAGADQALQRLQDDLRAATGVADGGLPRCAFSAGATLVMPGDHANSVFKRADQALYLAKARGRGQHALLVEA